MLGLSVLEGATWINDRRVCVGDLTLAIVVKQPENVRLYGSETIHSTKS